IRDLLTCLTEIVHDNIDSNTDNRSKETPDRNNIVGIQNGSDQVRNENREPQQPHAFDAGEERRANRGYDVKETTIEAKARWIILLIRNMIADYFRFYRI